MDGLKQALSFLGMLLMINLLMQITQVMFIFPQPINWNQDDKASGVFLFFEVEWLVFLGSIFSNILFIIIRSLFRNKV
jgi:hypothetical protein